MNHLQSGIHFPFEAFPEFPESSRHAKERAMTDRLSMQAEREVDYV